LAQKNQARASHWELTSEFDYMLSQLLAEDSMAHKEFVRRWREDSDTAGRLLRPRANEAFEGLLPGHCLLLSWRRLAWTPLWR